MGVVVGEEEIVISGIGVSPGIAFGPVHVEARGVAAPLLFKIPESEVAHELKRLKKAIERTRLQLLEVKDRVKSISGNSEEKIFDAHLLMLEDDALVKKVSKRIAEDFQNADYSFYAVMQTYAESLRRVNDGYLSERATDLDDICSRVLRNFSDSHAPAELPDHQHIQISFDLTPSDTALIDTSKVLGFATEQGSVTSHTAILARSLGIPAIVGIKDAVMNIRSLSQCILDGSTGKLVLNPKPETLKKYQLKKQKIEAEECEDYARSREQKITSTKDGHEVTLSANIEFSYEMEQVKESGASGVGLFRSEFFLLGDGEIPSEQAQFETYKKVAEEVGENLAIIRTLDAGGDKLPVEPLEEPEPNPFLGWRGIRVSLARKAMFKEQLRGILRASAYGNLGVMFPLVSGLSELLEAKAILKECMLELEAENIDFDKGMKVGVMIEVPSAAVLTDILADEVDFFSIGTNDLIQYTVAVDRVNPQVSHLYKPCNPAVIRLIKMTVEAGKKKGIWTGVCGEMAGALDIIPLLIGLGVTELSVGSHQLPKIKKLIGMLNMSDCERMAEQALTCRTAAEIRGLSNDVAEEAYGEFL